MDFVALIIFLCVYFIRPQDWVPGLMGRSIVNPIMGLAILGLFLRPRGLAFRDLLRTPLDWMMVIYYGYLVYTSPDSMGTLKAALPMFAFYFVARQALDNWGRLQRYLYFWTGAISVVALMGVLSTAGLDLTGAEALTAAFNGRLTLNTWLFNNPNALGHTVIVGLPLVYFGLFWRRPAFMKAASVPLFLLLGYCAYLTESKGAFLSGFVTICASMIFGRPKVAQLILILLASTIGITLLFQLPRMNLLNEGRADEGIVGRLLAWEMARTAARTNPYGEGWKQFEAVISWEGEEFTKATHSSYVKVGADLGYPGLFLFLGILCCGIRVLFQAQTTGTEQERVRRMLFAILVAYVVSSWMIDHAYHTEYFLLAGAIGAFHARLLRGTDRVLEEAEEREAEEIRSHPDAPVGIFGTLLSETRRASLLPATSGVAAEMYLTVASPPLSEPAQRGSIHVDGAAGGMEDDDAEGDFRLGTDEEAVIRWRRLGVLDFLLMLAAVKLVLAAWDYILENL